MKAIEVGQIYGRWRVRSVFRRKDTGQTWCMVTCECDVNSTVLGYNLTSGRSRGCKSCSARARVYEFDQGKFEASCVNDIYHNYKAGRKRGRSGRVLEFDLTQERFATLIAEPCSYCGVIGSNTKRRKKAEFRYNGIDRFDNTRGYVEGNVLPCCAICNRMKRDLTYDEFIGHVSRINKMHPAGAVLILANEKTVR